MDIIVTSDTITSRLNEVKDKKQAGVMREIASIMYEDTMENFAQEGRPKWKPLAKRTIQERTKLGYVPIVILQRTRTLLKSIQQDSDNENAVVFTNYETAEQLHEGDKKKHLPARPFFILSKEAEQEIVETINKYIEK